MSSQPNFPSIGLTPSSTTYDDNISVADTRLSIAPSATDSTSPLVSRKIWSWLRARKNDADAPGKSNRFASTTKLARPVQQKEQPSPGTAGGKDYGAAFGVLSTRMGFMGSAPLTNPSKKESENK